MPGPDEILAGLGAIANRWLLIALAWHVAVGVGLMAMSQGLHPSPRTGGVLLLLPVASVSVFAWVIGNPFNGAVFGILTVALAMFTARTTAAEVERRLWTTALGALLVAFAWFYPHFVEGPAIVYLFAAPMGLIPCPTLALVIGASLLGLGPDGRAWGLTLAGVGLFYSLFGALRLGVTIDLVLLAGAVGLAIRTMGHPHGVERGPQLAG